MTDTNVIPFNPLHKRHLGESVGQALLRRPLIAMGALTSFSGAGVYAIYYQGGFPAYEALASRNRQQGCVAPLWNLLIDGFGNHDPGSGRHAGVRPRWDVLHPGRSWGKKCQPREESAEQIAADARQYLRDHPPTGDADLITP